MNVCQKQLGEYRSLLSNIMMDYFLLPSDSCIFPWEVFFFFQTDFFNTTEKTNNVSQHTTISYILYKL